MASKRKGLFAWKKLLEKSLTHLKKGDKKAL
ncbi:hypothetical protein FHS80_001482 [Porphyromonas circumdentaria]|nr:hypothetical protein [Porphyromonas circumdentaria]